MRFGRRGRRVAESRAAPRVRLSAVGAQLREDPKRFERALRFAMQAARFPKFEEQYRYAPPRKFTADFAFLEQRVLVEVQGGIWRRGGGAHSHPKDIERDVEKAQHAAFHGWFVVPVITDQVTDGSALVIIERAFSRAG